MPFTSFLDGTRWSDVYTAATCAFLAGTALFTADFALTLQLQSDGYGGIAIAALIICATLPLVVLAPWTGRLADRFDSRALMAYSGLLQTAAIIAMTMTDNLYALFALVILNASGTAVLQPVVSALVPVMAGPEDLPHAIAMVQTGALIGLATGPAVAGFLIGANGTGAALLLAAGCAGARVLLCCDIRTRRGGIRREPVVAGAKPAAAWRLGGDRLLGAMVFGLSAVIAAMCAVNVLSVFLVREVYGASESTYGLVRSCWIVGMIGGAWIAAAVIRRLSRDVQLAWMLMACLAGVGLVCFGQGLPLFSVLLLVPLNLIGGIFNAGENAALGIAVARRVPEAFRGRANAAVGGRVNAAQLIGFLLGGTMSTVLDVRVAFMAVGLVSIGIVLACLPVIRRAADGDGTAGTPAAPEPKRDLAGAIALRGANSRRVGIRVHVFARKAEGPANAGVVFAGPATKRAGRRLAAAQRRPDNVASGQTVGRRERRPVRVVVGRREGRPVSGRQGLACTPSHREEGGAVPVLRARDLQGLASRDCGQRGAGQFGWKPA